LEPPLTTFNGFGQSPSSDEHIALFGDSKVVNGGSSIQLTDSMSRSEGRVFYRKPIQLFGGEGRNSGSFSTHFSFSMSNKTGGALAFVMVPSGLDLRLFGRKDNSSSGLGFLLQYEQAETRVVAVEFSTSMKGRRAGIVVGGPKSAKVGNLSSFRNFLWNNGEKLHCWIDYEASLKRIEVSMMKSDTKPADPLISYSIELAKLWKDGKFMVGLGSTNGNSSQPHFLYSWIFNIRHPAPAWMHSQPLDPNEVSKTEREGVVEKPTHVHRKGSCVWKMLTALILGSVCGTFGAMLALYLWTICGGRRPMAVAPVECTAKSVEAMVADKEEEEGNK
ncbi:PREDICTED: L-type lectin-domain containing receptor kinase VIII.2-like, partial [Tarenaya hassleriana]|uniref:L-type lectin-domain containing receptor kinase VIII.2-like n=1 Tax=Tarenaya hassleriana TaxID=28532 RepID=UPI00053C9E3C